MLEFLRIFLFDHKAYFVPEGRHRWEYVIDTWKTSDADYSMEDILGIPSNTSDNHASQLISIVDDL